MANTYYDSELSAEQIDRALKAISDVVLVSNNGKVLCITNGRIDAKSASTWSDSAVLEPGSASANGDYYPPAGVDGFNSFHVDVQSGGGGAVVQPLSVTENGTYNPSSGVDGFAPVTVNVSGDGGKQIEATVTVQNDVVVADGCSIVSQPVIVDGKMKATNSLGLQISLTYFQNVCLEVDYQYLGGSSFIVFSLGGSNTQSGVLTLSTTQFEFYASGSRIKRTDLSINFDQERHVKFIATANDELYVVVDNVLILSASNSYVHNILNYCFAQSDIAVGWNKSSHAEYNSGTFNNVKISFNVDLPNT